jgi:hypothetical protein
VPDVQAGSGVELTTHSGRLRIGRLSNMISVQRNLFSVIGGKIFSLALFSNTFNNVYVLSSDWETEIHSYKKQKRKNRQNCSFIYIYIYIYMYIYSYLIFRFYVIIK